MYKYFFKRIIDIVISFIGLIFLLPLFIIIGAIIFLSSGFPIFFRQKRLGKNNKIFNILKFRTMVNHAYENGGVATSSNDKRITKVGKFLRKTSLDELPQLINIFIGQMSIVGPRPILKEEFEAYNFNNEYKKRFSVRPGLFCTVDVKYRSACSREIQFEMDANYADNISFLIDIKTFFGVFLTVISGKNVYKEDINNQNNNALNEVCASKDEKPKDDESKK